MTRLQWLPVALVVMSVGCAAIRAGAPPATRAPPAATPLTCLPPGSTVVFLGDSITWEGGYTAVVASHFQRRYPTGRLRFVNLGQRGATTASTLERLAHDVFPLRPRLAIVMLGLNDGGYAWANRPRRQRYLDNLATLVERLRQREVEVLVVTPTCLALTDRRAARYNEALVKMAAGAVALGARWRVPVVDLTQRFCRALEMAQRAQLPVALMRDSIHPSRAGHLLVAREILAALDPQGPAAGGGEASGRASRCPGSTAR